MSENKEIRFIDSSYSELFRIPDGGSIVVTQQDGEEYIYKCRYLDETHFDINGSYRNIRQFAEMQESNGATVKPEDIPEINNGYRIIQRTPIGNKVFKLGFNPNAVQKYVTWQSYPDNPTRYDFAHYWNDKTIAKTDLYHRAESERRGVSYDDPKLIKQSRIRSFAK
jgi:hypothetical protein